MMKHIFIFCGPLSFGKGGMEKVASNLANDLIARGYQVAVGYYYRCIEGFEKKPAYNLHPDIKLYSWNQDTTEPKLYKNQINDFHPHVAIVFHASHDAIKLAKIFYHLNCATIFHEGSNPKRIIFNNWAKPRRISTSKAQWERECIYSLLTHIRFTLPEYCLSLSSHIRRKGMSFPNAVLPAHNSTVPKKLDERKRIINIGGLKKNKNAAVLVEAFAQLSGDFPDWELHIFSERFPKALQYITTIEDIITKYSLEKQIILHDVVENIYDEYAKASFHVISSLSEGLPTCLIEAMMHGIPSIGFSSCPGTNSLIKHEENGLLIADHDPVEELKTALKLFMGNPDYLERLGAAAFLDTSPYHPKTIYDIWEKFIQNSYQNFLSTQNNTAETYRSLNQYERLKLKHNQRMGIRLLEFIE